MYGAAWCPLKDYNAFTKLGFMGTLIVTIDTRVIAHFHRFKTIKIGTSRRALSRHSCV